MTDKHSNLWVQTERQKNIDKYLGNSIFKKNIQKKKENKLILDKSNMVEQPVNSRNISSHVENSYIGGGISKINISQFSNF